MIILKKTRKCITTLLVCLCVGCSNSTAENKDINLNPKEEIHYDQTGEVISKDEFEYDGNNQLISKKGLNDEVSYSYSNGVVTKSIRLNGYSNYTYDDMKQLIKIETFNENDELIEVRTHEYDVNGNVCKSVFQVGSEEPVVSIYEFDSNNKITSVAVGDSMTSYEYDKLGNCISEVSFSNGVMEEKIISTYKDKLLDTQTIFTSDTSELMRLQYVYDDNKRLIEILSSMDGGKNFYKSVEYSY